MKYAVTAGVFVISVLLLGVKEDNIGTIEKALDVVNSRIVNDSLYLTVFVNREEDMDTSEIADMIIRMYRENDFYSVKFSADILMPEFVEIEVYTNGTAYKDYQRLFVIEFYPLEDIYFVKDVYCKL